MQTALILPALRAAGLGAAIRWWRARSPGSRPSGCATPRACTSRRSAAPCGARPRTSRADRRRSLADRCPSRPRARLADRGPVAARATGGRQPQRGRAADRRLGLPTGQRDDGRQRRHRRCARPPRSVLAARAARSITASTGGRAPRERLARPRARMAARDAEPGRRLVGVRPRAAGQAARAAVLRPGRGVARGPGRGGPDADRSAARARRSLDRGPDRPGARRPRPRRSDHRVAGGAARDRVPARPAVRPRRLLGALDRQLPGLDGVRAPGTRARRRRHVRAVGAPCRRVRARTPERRRGVGRAARFLPRPRTRRPRPEHAAAHRPRADRADRRGRGIVEAVTRGIAYLLDRQRADGTWPHGDWLQAIVPPDTFYILAEAARHYPVEALARWLEPPDPFRGPRRVTRGAGTGCPRPRPTSGRGARRAGP